MIQLTNNFNDNSYIKISIKSIKEKVLIIANNLSFGIDLDSDYEKELQKKINIIFNYLNDEKINKIAFDLNNLDSYSISFMNDLVDLIDSYRNDYEIIIVIPHILSKSNLYDKFIVECHNYNEEDESLSLESDFAKFDENMTKEPLFRVHLRNIMFERGLTLTELSKISQVGKSVISRSLDSKKNPPHQPTRETVCALAISLRFTFEEAEKFYYLAGYSITKNNFLDKLLRFCIKEKIYDMFEVNCLLYNLNRPPLGEKLSDVEVIER